MGILSECLTHFYYGMIRRTLKWESRYEDFTTETTEGTEDFINFCVLSARRGSILP